MSFGARKPTAGPPRSTRPAVAKKAPIKPAVRSGTKATQPTAKPKATPVVVPPKKPAPVAAPKPSVPKPPTPDPVYDYESDFESDESVPSAESSSSEAHVDNTESDDSTSEGGDDEGGDNDDDDADDDDDDDARRVNEDATIGKEGYRNAQPEADDEPKESSQSESVKYEPKKQTSNPRNARSVDILSKISLNDVTMGLYQFDPEEYAELRTHFGITTVVAHAKHIQTDSSLVSTAQQTSRVVVRDRYTSMQGGLVGLHNEMDEDDSYAEKVDDEEDVQNYSSLQNIERMFTTLNGALDRMFSKGPSLRTGIAAAPHKRNPNQQRIILQLVRKSAPIFEALLEAKRLRSTGKTEAEPNGTDDRPYQSHRLSTDVIRSFDTGKLCAEYEVKLLHAKSQDQSAPMDRFVIEFWARGTYSRPMYRFSSWCPVQCVDYECRKQMMVFGGTSDGTLQMWLGDAGRCYNEILAPHQIVAPHVGRKHKLSCWELVTVKVLPVPLAKDSTLENGNENVLNQVFGLFSTGIIIVWHVQMDTKDKSASAITLNARLGRPNVSLVQSKVIDLNSRIGGRLAYDSFRSFSNLLLHDHHQMVLSSERSVVRLSHFVESEYDPALLIQPDSTHSIMNLKRMAQTNDTLFVLYSNKTVRVLKLSMAPDGPDSARNRHRKHDNQPNLMLSVCTNKSCTIQSIVHDEAKRYGNTNSVGGGRADGGTVAPKSSDLEKSGSEMLCTRPRFHHGQQILFFGSCHPENLLNDENFKGKSVMFPKSK